MTEQAFLADDIITEVRRHKQAIASEHGFDVVALGRALQAREMSDPRFKKQCEQGRGANALPRAAHD